MIPTTGVWWDLDSCPVPADNISHDLLKKISSSGILLRHTPQVGSEVFDLLEQEWKKPHPPPAPIMLISRDGPWFSDLTSLGYTILQYSHSSDVKTNCQVLEDELPAWFCFLCEITSQTFDDFIEHLKSEGHRKELFDSVPLYMDDNDRPKHFCQLCKYPTFDTYTMAIHYNSEIHAQKVLEQAGGGVSQNLVAGPSEKEDSLAYQPNTSQEEEEEDQSSRRGSLEQEEVGVN
ncbi:unnamed protein product [Arabis nemorensis]|uniref:Uncharacterized protein n=1 Tax=Arabis nemorensis TaxID=586526 RepID=A0A565C780_9BRAS|nr:unnamed protein product [Arabis nemorensis]